MELQSSMRNVAGSIHSKFHTYGFWVLIIFIVGFVSGLLYCENKLETKTGESVLLQGMIYKGEVYNIEKRD